MRPGACNSRSGEPFLFLGVCLYILSQAYTIPLIGIGPSWAIWPTAGDIVVAFLMPFALVRSNADRYTRQISVALVGWIAVCAGSFAVMVALDSLGVGVSGAGKEVGFGEYGVYRLLQVLVVFRAVAGCTLDAKRVRILHWVTVVTFFLICVGVWGTYLNIIPTRVFTAHLPQSKVEAGAWFYYMHPDDYALGLGTIGYNHGYAALQLIASAMAALFLGDVRRTGGALRVALLLSCLVSVFLTGSRAGLIAAALFAGMELVNSSRKSLALVCAGIGMAILLSSFVDFSLPSDADQAVARLRTISTSFDEDGLAGRTPIWEDRISSLRAVPVRLFVGEGFGSASGLNAHMFPLQLIMETGLLGALAFCWLGFRVSEPLRRAGIPVRVVLSGSFVLLATCLTQETFYPVPAFGHFLGFYFAIVAAVIACRRSLAPRLGARVTASTRIRVASNFA